MVSRQAGTGFSGLGKLKAEALREADEFCAGEGKSVELLESMESEPPYVLGNYPRVEIIFRCVAAPDADTTTSNDETGPAEPQ
jgi:hypothetical protein